MKKIFNQKQKGFVVLFSIVISAIILLMSAAVFRIASQQLILSGTSRESMRAFYAADSGIECAMGNGLQTALTYPPSVDCAGLTPRIVSVFASGAEFTVSFLDNTCAQVSIIDSEDLNTGLPIREIFSRGFNTACPSGEPDYAYQSLVERSLHIRFVQPGAAPVVPSSPFGNAVNTGISLNPFNGTGGGTVLSTALLNPIQAGINLLQNTQ